MLKQGKMIMTYRLNEILTVKHDPSCNEVPKHHDYCGNNF